MLHTECLSPTGYLTVFQDHWVLLTTPDNLEDWNIALDCSLGLTVPTLYSSWFALFAWLEAFAVLFGSSSSLCTRRWTQAGKPPFFPNPTLRHSLHRFGQWSHPFGGNEACISLPANRRWISWITIFPLVTKVYVPMRQFLKSVYYTDKSDNVKNFLKLF